MVGNENSRSGEDPHFFLTPPVAILVAKCILSEVAKARHAQKGSEMKITKIDRATTRMIASRVEAALAELGRELGVKVSYSGGSYDATRANLKISVEVVDGAGVSEAGKRDFTLWAKHYGLAETDLGRTFAFRGTVYEITGINPNAPKFAIQAKRIPDGKPFRFPPEIVRPLMALGRAAA